MSIDSNQRDGVWERIFLAAVAESVGSALEIMLYYNSLLPLGGNGRSIFDVNFLWRWASVGPGGTRSGSISAMQGRGRFRAALGMLHLPEKWMKISILQ
jgi:hypothetical protein